MSEGTQDDRLLEAISRLEGSNRTRPDSAGYDAPDDERVCAGCGTPVPDPEERVGWRFTDAPWCPKHEWLA